MKCRTARHSEFLLDSSNNKMFRIFHPGEESQRGTVVVCSLSSETRRPVLPRCDSPRKRSLARLTCTRRQRLLSLARGHGSFHLFVASLRRKDGLGVTEMERARRTNKYKGASRRRVLSESCVCGPLFSRRHFRSSAAAFARFTNSYGAKVVLVVGRLFFLSVTSLRRALRERAV